jgi:integral membrane protein (TIGR01906 family)
MLKWYIMISTIQRAGFPERRSNLRVIKTTISCVFIICLPVLLLSASLAWGFNSTWLLEYGFDKYDVSGTTQLSGEELNTIAGDWVRYINSQDEYWRITFLQNGKSWELFSPEERIHFRDVKNLIRLDYNVLLVSFCLFLIYVLTSIFYRQGRYRRMLVKNICLGSGLTILLTIIIGVASVINFDALFIQLHHLIFTNSYWSANGYMLLLFPGGFWFDAAIICVAFMVGIALILGCLSVVYLKKTSHA